MNLCINESEYYAECDVREDENGPYLHEMDCVVVTVAGVHMDISLEVAANTKAFYALEERAIKEYQAIKLGDE